MSESLRVYKCCPASLYTAVYVCKTETLIRERGIWQNKINDYLHFFPQCKYLYLIEAIRGIVSICIENLLASHAKTSPFQFKDAANGRRAFYFFKDGNFKRPSTRERPNISQNALQPGLNRRKSVVCDTTGPFFNRLPWKRCVLVLPFPKGHSLG